ncbi:MAG: ligase-associated DNA damage response endonuclease PdeM [Sphingomonadaceae bacterium]|nr:ligase-associated DNA damage response endonuclease PdeM [Sphingomonadaceae bacterium]
MVPVPFAGHTLVPLSEGALWWPARRTLLAADLHLEKASHYARRGQMLPPYDSVETLGRLHRLAARLAPDVLYLLGDSFHDCDGPERLSDHACALIERLAAALRLVWITGNHDPRGTPGEALPYVALDGITLRHEADPRDAAPEISGHFHPKLSVGARGRLVSRRCFVIGPTKLILPAFGSLAGGLDARSAPILAAAGRPAAALIPAADRLHRFQLAA